jgi:pimeloyl-ACP methyl ester carboxylesterase
MVNRASTIDALTKLPAIPSLVAVGEHDKVTPLGMVKEVADALKTRPLVQILNETGHFVRSTQIVQLLNQFLDKK